MKRILQIILEIFLVIITFCITLLIVSKYDEVHHIDIVVDAVRKDNVEDVKLYEDYITASTNVVNMQKKDEFLVEIPKGYDDTNFSVYIDKEWENVAFRSVGSNQYSVEFTEKEDTNITYRIQAFNSEGEVIMCYFSYNYQGDKGSN